MTVADSVAVAEQPFDEDLLREARELGTATLHEAGGRIGALPSRLQALSGDLTVAGPALPVLVSPGNNLWLHHAIVAAAPGDVLVVAAAGGHEFGYFGEVMAVGAQSRGIAGLVIDAGVRDVKPMIALGFPVFAERHCIKGTGKDPLQPGSIGAPVVIGEISVRRGDLIVGDADGVVCIPRERAQDVVAEGRRRQQAEESYFARLREGETTLDIYQLPDVRPSV